MKTTVGTLYLLELSPAVRAVLLTAEALNIDFERKRLNLFQGEHKEKEFTTINPLHTVPTFVDNDGTTICDSHAIMAFLVDKYATSDELYPKDPKKRAAVNQSLFLESSKFGPVHQDFYYEMWIKEAIKPKPENFQRVSEVFDMANIYLGDKEYVAGDHVTIADFSLVATISSLCIKAAMENKHVALINWMKRMADLPFYEKANGSYLPLYEKILNNCANEKGTIRIDWLSDSDE